MDKHQAIWDAKYEGVIPGLQTGFTLRPRVDAGARSTWGVGLATTSGCFWNSGGYQV